MSYNNQDDCGCGNNANLSILNNNNNMNHTPMLPNNAYNNQQQQVNNQPQQQVNNQPQQQVNNQQANNQLANNLANNSENNQVNTLVNNKEENSNKMRELNLFLCILAALAVNEAAKYFINKSIRLNSGTSSRYIYYALVCVGVLVLYNLC